MTDRVRDLTPGEKVLVSPIRVNFAIAKVVTPERDDKVVVASRHGNEFVAAAQHVYPLRPGHRTKARPDCYGACKPGSGWIPCLVSNVEGSRLEARDRNGQVLTLAPNEVVVFDPEVQTEVRNFFAEAAYERAFHAAVAAAGAPRQQPEPVQEGDIVLAPLGEKYLLAQVDETGAGTCSLRWLASSMKSASRSTKDIVRVSTTDGGAHTMDPGSFVLAPARGKVSTETLQLAREAETRHAKLPTDLRVEWEPMRVETVYPDGRLLLSDAHQKEHERAASTVVAYRRE